MEEVNNKKQNNNKRNKRRKNGIWFSSSEALDIYAHEKASHLQNIIENIIFYAITIPLQLVQTVGVFLIAYFNDAFPSLSFFLVGFFFTRSFLGETFHLNSTVSCTTFTWTLFYIITAVIPSIYISVFLCILLGCFLSIYMHYVVIKEEEKCQED